MATIKIDFVKMSGSGNDFVVLDNRENRQVREVDKRRFVESVCARRTGVGADGVLFVEGSETADFRMRYFNSDGGEVEFCGNGARCAARFAQSRLCLDNPVRFESLSGTITASIDSDSVCVLMPPVSEPEGPEALELNGVALEYFFIDTGVPHVVVFVDDLPTFRVADYGRMIRYGEIFAPEGTNVDFVHVSDRGDADIDIRTYERGVEGETLACGTGAVASALVAANLGMITLPAKVRVALPDILIVDLDENGRPTLAGEVAEVFEGVYCFEV